MTLPRCCGILLCLVPAAEAHRFAPSLLKVTEIAPQYNVVWKTPVQGPAYATAPCGRTPAVANAAPPMEGTGMVSTWQLAAPLGEAGLVGRRWVSRAGVNQASAW